MSKTKDVKPRIEDAMSEVFSGSVLHSALEMIAYLREHKLNPQWSAANVWKVIYKTYSVCFIRLYGAAAYHGLEAGTWHIVPFVGEYEEFSLSDEYKEIVWAHQRTCSNCGRCSLKLDKIFGKEFEYTCEKSIVFTNPDLKDIECIKKLVDLRIAAIKTGKAKKHKYIPMKNRVT